MSENPQKKSRIEKLELNLETVNDLSEAEAEQAKGGLAVGGLRSGGGNITSSGCETINCTIDCTDNCAGTGKCMPID